jgi:hypothetical protein
MYRIHRLKLRGGWLCHLLCLTLDMGVLCMLVHLLRMIRMDFRLCLLCIVLIFTFQCLFGSFHAKLGKVTRLFFLIGI